MEGRGVSSYGDQKSYQVSGSTTQFDDELMNRGIVNRHQVYLAKGATPEEAERLVQQHEASQKAQIQPEVEIAEKKDVNDEIDSDDDEYYFQDADDVMERYKATRQRQRYGSMIRISRDQWNAEVNDAEPSDWVIVCLTCSGITNAVEDACSELAVDHPSVKFVSIDFQQAIDNFPSRHLPALFLYREGKLQHQLLELERSLTREDISKVLYKHDVI